MVFLFFQERLQYFYSTHCLHFQYFIVTFQESSLKRRNVVPMKQIWDCQYNLGLAQFWKSGIIC